MAIRINPLTPNTPLPLNPLKRIIIPPPIRDAGKIINPKNIGPGKLGIRRDVVDNGLHKALVDETKKYI